MIPQSASSAWAYVAISVALVAGAPVAAGQSGADTLAIRRRMSAYMKIRQFRDIDALRLVFHPQLYAGVRDSLPSMYSQFRARFPNAPLTATSPDLKRFLDQRTPQDTTDRTLLDAFASAFRKLEAGNAPDDAVWTLLAPGLLPPPTVSVDSSRFELARWQDDAIVFYLTEFRTGPLPESPHIRRLIVEWRRFDREWFVTSVR
jgi:hypothetical protein